MQPLVIACHNMWCHSQFSTTLQLTLRWVVLPAKQIAFGVSVSRCFMKFEDVHLGDNLPVLGWNLWSKLQLAWDLMNLRACQESRLERAYSPIITSRWLRCILSPGFCMLQRQGFTSLWRPCVNFGWKLTLLFFFPHSSYHYGQARANFIEVAHCFCCLLSLPFYLCLTQVWFCQDGEKSKSLREAQVLEVNVMPSNGVPSAAFHHARNCHAYWVFFWEGNNSAPGRAYFAAVKIAWSPDL